MDIEKEREEKAKRSVNGNSGQEEQRVDVSVQVLHQMDESQCKGSDLKSRGWKDMIGVTTVCGV